MRSNKLSLLQRERDFYANALYDFLKLKGLRAVWRENYAAKRYYHVDCGGGVLHMAIHFSKTQFEDWKQDKSYTERSLELIKEFIASDVVQKRDRRIKLRSYSLDWCNMFELSFPIGNQALDEYNLIIRLTLNVDGEWDIPRTFRHGQEDALSFNDLLCVDYIGDCQMTAEHFYSFAVLWNRCKGKLSLRTRGLIQVESWLRAWNIPRGKTVFRHIYELLCHDVDKIILSSGYYSRFLRCKTYRDVMTLRKELIVFCMKAVNEFFALLIKCRGSQDDLMKHLGTPVVVSTLGDINDVDIQASTGTGVVTSDLLFHGHIPLKKRVESLVSYVMMPNIGAFFSVQEHCPKAYIEI